MIWVQHSDDELEYGSDGWQIVPELIPLAGERLVEKNFGAQTDGCVRSTACTGRSPGGTT
ncbi:hypothetical protein BH11ACT6_BH11ACT6_40280 [soil metagenome]